MSHTDKSRKRVYYEGQPMNNGKRRVQRRATTKQAAIAAAVKEG